MMPSISAKSAVSWVRYVMACVELVHGHDRSHHVFGVRLFRSDSNTVPEPRVIGDLIRRLTKIDVFEAGTASAHQWIVGRCKLRPYTRTLELKLPSAILNV